MLQTIPPVYLAPGRLIATKLLVVPAVLIVSIIVLLR